MYGILFVHPCDTVPVQVIVQVCTCESSESRGSLSFGTLMSGAKPLIIAFTLGLHCFLIRFRKSVNHATWIAAPDGHGGHNCPFWEDSVRKDNRQVFYNNEFPDDASLTNLNAAADLRRFNDTIWTYVGEVCYPQRIERERPFVHLAWRPNDRSFPY